MRWGWGCVCGVAPRLGGGRWGGAPALAVGGGRWAAGGGRRAAGGGRRATASATGFGVGWAGTLCGSYGAMDRVTYRWGCALREGGAGCDGLWLLLGGGRAACGDE